MNRSGWLVPLLVFGCRADKVVPTPKADPTPVASASDEIVPPLQPSAGGIEPLAPATSTSAPTRVAHSAALVDVGAWLRDRGVAASPTLAASSCYSIRIAALDALMCYGPPSEMLTGGESVFPLSIITVSGGRATTALTTPIAAGALDPEVDFDQPAQDPHYITLDAAFDSAGTLTISEKPGKSCAKVLADFASPDLVPHRKVIQKACAARGKYTLQGGKLVRAP
jgi:hypothetical protein